MVLLLGYPGIVFSAEYPHWKAIAKADLIVLGRLNASASPKAIQSIGNRGPTHLLISKVITNRLGVEVPRCLKLINTTQDSFVKAILGFPCIFFLQADYLTIKDVMEHPELPVNVPGFAVSTASDVLVANQDSVRELQRELISVMDKVNQVHTIKGCLPEAEKVVAEWLLAVSIGAPKIAVDMDDELTQSIMACLLSRAIAPSREDLAVSRGRTRISFNGHHETYTVSSSFQAVDCLLMMYARCYFGASWFFEGEYSVRKSVFGWKMYSQVNHYSEN